MKTNKKNDNERRTGVKSVAYQKQTVDLNQYLNATILQKIVFSICIVRNINKLYFLYVYCRNVCIYKVTWLEIFDVFWLNLKNNLTEIFYRKKDHNFHFLYFIEVRYEGQSAVKWREPEQLIHSDLSQRVETLIKEKSLWREYIQKVHLHLYFMSIEFLINISIIDIKCQVISYHWQRHQCKWVSSGRSQSSRVKFYDEHTQYSSSFLVCY